MKHTISAIFLFAALIAIGFIALIFVAGAANLLAMVIDFAIQGMK